MSSTNTYVHIGGCVARQLYIVGWNMIFFNRILGDFFFRSGELLLSITNQCFIRQEMFLLDD